MRSKAPTGACLTVKRGRGIAGALASVLEQLYAVASPERPRIVARCQKLVAACHTACTGSGGFQPLWNVDVRSAVYSVGKAGHAQFSRARVVKTAHARFVARVPLASGGRPPPHFSKIELLTPVEPVTSTVATGAGQLQVVADARHSRDHVRLLVFLAPGDGVGEGLAGTGADTVPLL